MAEIEIVFRTQSEIEASVVEGLLESQDLHVVRLAGPPANVFAFAVTPLGEILIGVPQAEAADARRVLLSHGDAGGAGLVVPQATALRDVEARLRYTFRDRGLLEHALTHKSRAAEDPSGGVVDNESLEFLGDAILGQTGIEDDQRHLLRAKVALGDQQLGLANRLIVECAGGAFVQMQLGAHRPIFAIQQHEQTSQGRAAAVGDVVILPVDGL